MNMNEPKLEKICDKILNLNPQVRFVEIVYKDKICAKTRPDLDNFLTSKETEKSIDDALARWNTRKKLADKLGEPVYAIAEYKKVKRITIPVNHDGLILVSIDPTGFHEVLLKEIIEIKEETDWDL